MSVQTQWGDEAQTIVIQAFDAGFTMDDYYRAVDENAVLMATVPHSVDLIVDASQISSEIGIQTLLPAAKYSNSKVPDNQRLVIVVGSNYLLNAIFTMVKRIAPRSVANLQLANALEEAHQLIADYRASLPR